MRREGRNRILLVEDNPGDVDLVREALASSRAEIRVARDGVEALAILRDPAQPRPDLILLDLNLPRVDGREVLRGLKGDPGLRHIPVVVLTSSGAERDLLQAYQIAANCYVTKPVDLDEFLAVVSGIERFWLHIARLPPSSGASPPAS